LFIVQHIHMHIRLEIVNSFRDELENVEMIS